MLGYARPARLSEIDENMASKDDHVPSRVWFIATVVLLLSALALEVAAKMQTAQAVAYMAKRGQPADHLADHAEMLTAIGLIVEALGVACWVRSGSIRFHGGFAVPLVLVAAYVLQLLIIV